MVCTYRQQVSQHLEHQAHDQVDQRTECTHMSETQIIHKLCNNSKTRYDPFNNNNQPTLYTYCAKHQKSGHGRLVDKNALVCLKHRYTLGMITMLQL